MVADMTTMPQILAQHLLALYGERQAKVAVEMPLMRLVEQHGGDAGEIGIAQYRRNENRLGHHENAGFGGALAVEPGEIAGRLPRPLAQQLRHPLGGGARGDTAGGEQDNLAGAPGFRQQGRCDSRRLARARRRNQHRRMPLAQGGKQVRQHGVDGKLAHRRLHRGLADRE